MSAGDLRALDQQIEELERALERARAASDWLELKQLKMELNQARTTRRSLAPPALSAATVKRSEKSDSAPREPIVTQKTRAATEEKAEKEAKKVLPKELMFFGRPKPSAPVEPPSQDPPAPTSSPDASAKSGATVEAPLDPPESACAPSTDSPVSEEERNGDETPPPSGPSWLSSYPQLPEAVAEALLGVFNNSDYTHSFAEFLSAFQYAQLEHLQSLVVAAGRGDGRADALEGLVNDNGEMRDFPTDQVGRMRRLLGDSPYSSRIEPSQASNHAARIFLVRAHLFRILVVVERVSPNEIAGRIEEEWHGAKQDVDEFVKQCRERARLAKRKLGKGEFHHARLPAILNMIRNALSHTLRPTWLDRRPLPKPAFDEACFPYMLHAIQEWLERESWMTRLARGTHIKTIDDGWIFRLDRPGRPPIFIPRIDDNVDPGAECLLDAEEERFLCAYVPLSKGLQGATP